jgi:hypothetical protein
LLALFLLRFRLSFNHKALIISAVLSFLLSYSAFRQKHTIEASENGITKYKEMLMATVKDALEILGYSSAEKIESDIFGMTQKSKKNNVPQEEL